MGATDSRSCRADRGRADAGSRRGWVAWPFPLVALAVAVGGGSAVRGQEEPVELETAVEKLREARLELIEARAELDALGLIAGVYDGPGPSGPATEFGADPSIIREALRGADTARGDRDRALDELGRKLRGRRQQAEKAWREVVAAEEAEAPPWGDPPPPAEATEARPIDGASVVAELASPATLMIPVGLLPLGLAVLALGLLGRRGELKSRRRCRGTGVRRVAGVVVLAALALPSISGCGPEDGGLGDDLEAEPQAGEEAEVGGAVDPENDRRLEAVESQRREVEAELATVRARVDEEREAVRAKAEAAVARELAPLSPSDEATNSGRVAELTQAEVEAQVRVRSILVEAGVAAAVTADASRRLEGMRVRELSRLRSAAADRRLAQIGGITRVALALGLIGLFVLFVRRSEGRSAERVVRANQVCPRCLEPGLVRVPLDILGADGRPLEIMQCPTCNHEFDARYQDLERICLPMIGVRGSGKTHWGLLAYHMIKYSQIPVRSRLITMPSHGTAAFDELSDQVVERGYAPEGNFHGLPDPVLIHVSDCDPLGPRSLLVNLFDFAGEVMNVNMDQMRRRALLSDGFFYFLDPTQVPPDPTGRRLTLSDQINALAAYYQSLCAVRNLRFGTPVDMPIAICVSKIDLLEETAMSDFAAEWTSKLRESISATVSLRLIQERSLFLERALDMMFPGVDLVRSVREKFGNSFMFFPVTPIGLEPNARIPFGILEPLLWMLYMKGYDVFR